jgi:hypothetical protein
MRVTGKFFPTSVGLCFIAFALIVAVLLLPGAKGSQSPFLYVCILGGLFVGIPTALGIGVVVENFASEGEFVPRTSHLHEVNERSHLVTTVITCKGAQPLRSERGLRTRGGVASRAFINQSSTMPRTRRPNAA